jgi:hypothetical protein
MASGRRVRCFGYRYIFEREALELIPGKDGEPYFPAWMDALRARILTVVDERTGASVFPSGHKLDQLIVNEYCPSHGIKLHKDRTHCFGKARRRVQWHALPAC